MPELILQVVSMDAIPPAQPLMRVFDDAGGTIGRDESNVFALPDKHRRVSRLHATISFPGGMATITNSSTSLPISVGEQQVDSGESMPLANGALVEIGPYVLRAVVPVPHVSTAQTPASHEPSVQLRVGGNQVQSDPLDAPVYIAKLEPSVAVRADPLIPSSPPSQARSVFDADNAQERNLAHAPLPQPIIKLPPISTDHVTATRDSDALGGDPFANLLAGIGTGPTSNSPAPAVLHQQVSAGASTDPLVAFQAMPHSSVEGLPFAPRGTLSPLPNTAMSGALIPDDFNPFELPSSTERNAADPLASLLGSTSEGSAGTASAVAQPAPSIDSLFQSGTTGTSVTPLTGSLAPGVLLGDGLSSLLQPESASDPFALFDNTNDVPLPSNRPMRDDSLEVGSSFMPPAPMRENGSEILHSAAQKAAAVPGNPLLGASAATPIVAPSPLNAADAVSPDVLTEAFLKGAGLAPGALPHGLTPEIMSIVGSLLRSATAGAVDMLAARAATKREVQASVTIISVQANNPLKFLPNADAALLQLLGKKMPGFMRADVAMRDAFEDLRAHEVGVIAGTRAALTEVLGKFDPAVLGDKLARGSVLESLVPSARKAKLWDMYLERYLQIRREAEDDFQSIFGRAFVQAYERETARIKGDSPASGEGRA